ncbi:BSD domain-containing protein [Artemisia annua]|uniref:BSD domain-containing protein n=1 Tax=Artemisia annua TaxID=35608 RepID=A0A2U1NQ81_ARTAN|nr:BSD domain-containing protein [Artemisia annua]
MSSSKKEIIYISSSETNSSSTEFDEGSWADYFPKDCGKGQKTWTAWMHTWMPTWQEKTEKPLITPLVHKLAKINFNMTDVQKDHASAIEQLVPDLTTLKHKMLNCMSGEQFWLIYFILLIPRLNEDDFRLLSTPEIDQVREVLQQLRNQKNTHDEKGSMVNSTKQSEGDQTGDAQIEIQSSRLSSASENSDWVRLSAKAKANRSTYRERHSESEESSDWHAVEDTDL